MNYIETCDINVLIEITSYLDAPSTVRFISTCKRLYSIKKRVHRYEMINDFENPPKEFPLTEEAIYRFDIEDADTKRCDYSIEFRFIESCKFGYTRLCEKFLNMINGNKIPFLLVGIALAFQHGNKETASFLLEKTKPMHTNHHYTNSELRNSRLTLFGGICSLIDRHTVPESHGKCFSEIQDKFCIKAACKLKEFSYVDWLANNSCKMNSQRVYYVCSRMIYNLESMAFALSRIKVEHPKDLIASLNTALHTIKDEIELKKVIEMMEDACGECVCQHLVFILDRSLDDNEEKKNKLKSFVEGHKARLNQKLIDTIVKEIDS